LKKKVFPPKSNRGKHFSKSQKSASKFWKTPQTKKMHNKTFKCSKLLLFFKKIQVDMVKNVKKTVQNRWLYGKCVFVAVFYVFHHVYLNFFGK
jgi:hypothetical protein